MSRKRPPWPFIVLAGSVMLAVYVGLGYGVWAYFRRPVMVTSTYQPPGIEVITPKDAPPLPPAKVIIGIWVPAKSPGFYGRQLTIYRDNDGLWMAGPNDDGKGESRLPLVQGKTPEGQTRYHFATRAGVGLREDSHFRVIDRELVIYADGTPVDTPGMRYKPQ